MLILILKNQKLRYAIIIFYIFEGQIYDENKIFELYIFVKLNNNKI